MGSSEESPLEEKWAILAIVGILIVALLISVHYGPYVILTDASFQATTYICFSVVAVLMTTEIVRKRTRTLVAFVGALCLIAFVPIQIVSLVKDGLSPAFWCTISLTLAYSILVLFSAVWKRKIRWPEDI